MRSASIAEWIVRRCDACFGGRHTCVGVPCEHSVTGREGMALPQCRDRNPCQKYFAHENNSLPQQLGDWHYAPSLSKLSIS